MNMVNKDIKRPLLRYCGGKWRLAPWVIQHFPYHFAYIEPFGGAGSVLFRKPKSLTVKTEVWNDLNSELYNLFSILRNDEQAKELIRQCELTPFSREEFASSYDASENPIENARNFIIRSFFGFGSKAFLNHKQNGFRSFRYTENSPAIDWSTYPSALSVIVQRFKGVVVEHEPALKIIRRYDKEETLFYCDPPYVHSARKSHQPCYNHELTDADHEELAEVLHSIKGMAIISGYPSDLYENLYKDWKCVTKETYADMAKTPRLECLWLSPEVSKRLEVKKKACPLLCVDN